MPRKSAIYQLLESKWAAGVPTILDGATGSELQAMGYPREVGGRRPLNFTWGTLALYDAPDLTRQLHRRYIDAGARILETNTFLLHRVRQMEQDGDLDVRPGTWRDKARLSVRLAREAAEDAGRTDIAVAFALEGSDYPSRNGCGTDPPPPPPARPLQSKS